MRGPAVVAAAMLLGLAPGAGAQERPNAEPTNKNSTSWFSRLWPFSRKSEPPKKQEDSEPKKLTLLDSAASVRARELAAFERRKAVCLRLQEIALQTRDEELERRAEEMMRLAWDTYLLRTSHLAGPSGLDGHILTQRPGPSDVAARKE